MGDLPNKLRDSDILWDNITTSKYDISIIKAGTNWGKTYFSINNLPSKLNTMFPLSLVPIESIKRQSVNDYVNAEYLYDSELLEQKPRSKNVRIACFSKLAQILSEGKTINNVPDLLILDEIDLLAKWSMCFEGYLLAWDWILSNRKDMVVVGLTATPELLTDYVRGISFGVVTRPLPAKCMADKVEVVQHSTAQTYLKSLNITDDRKVLVYIKSAKQCAAMASQYPHAGFLVSIYNEDTIEDGGKPLYQLMNEQPIGEFHSREKTLRDYILENKRLPHGYNLLFFNDANLVGVNIEDEKVKHVICESVDQSAIIQSIGRVRHDLETITIITNSKNKKLFFEDLERARGFFENDLFRQNDYSYLCGFHQEEQNQIKRAKRQGKRIIGIDILTYKGLDGRIKVNPFAKACYEYIFDIYQKLALSWTAEQYFLEILKPFSVTGRIIFIEADRIRQNAANSININQNLLEDYIDRDLFSKDKAELKELCRQYKLVDKSRHIASWTTLKNYLPSIGLSVHDGKKINPETKKQERYSRILRKCSQGQN